MRFIKMLRAWWIRLTGLNTEQFLQKIEQQCKPRMFVDQEGRLHYIDRRVHFHVDRFVYLTKEEKKVYNIKKWAAVATLAGPIIIDNENNQETIS